MLAEEKYGRLVLASKDIGLDLDLNLNKERVYGLHKA
ncbi:hypothetical protein AQULUS_20070 [Aquicella lusitana]|uniref:Uncharacterized protein n=1 Tax=Aquicella lusitana TaxID=254246 RepID=A0A370GS94_9COXI|nr:hypothetical protein C8D86_105102 [Aquicella lusitana]VVC74242.1 hypothetical protein AQULUS_20070 [Aquicella lusitana]